MKMDLQSFVPELIALALLTGLPLLGLVAGNLPLERYLEFPPLMRYVEHYPFAWGVFGGLALLILAGLTPLVIRVFSSWRKMARELPNDSIPLMWPDDRNQRRGRDAAPYLRTPEGRAQPPAEPKCSPQKCVMPALHRPGFKRNDLIPTLTLVPAPQRRFPAWGWLGLAFGISAWILAWTRFDWFAPLQPFTFSPLWLGYIITVNALTWRRTHWCMLTHRWRYFLLLFPVSSLFWWFFEYLNRFVQNWYYVGVDPLTPLEYFIYAALPFATVLPAVMGTCDLLATYPQLYVSFSPVWPLHWVRPRPAAVVVLLAMMAGLTILGVWPNYTFPLLWLAPIGILASIQTLAGRTTLLTECRRGDWRRAVLLAISALICGFFWEMWNYYSLAKWVYAVPFVNRFHIFEMPVLGYAGYLPFGLECALIADRVAAWSERRTAGRDAGRHLSAEGGSASGGKVFMLNV